MWKPTSVDKPIVRCFPFHTADINTAKLLALKFYRDNYVNQDFDSDIAKPDMDGEVERLFANN